MPITNAPPTLAADQHCDVWRLPRGRFVLDRFKELFIAFLSAENTNVGVRECLK
jgi:hypothetical protein